MPVVLLTPPRFNDSRGWFSETYHPEKFKKLGVDSEFVQDNQSLSVPKGTLRGLHFQTPPFAQAKLVRVVVGAIYDVAVDIRAHSPTYGKWVGAKLTAQNGEQLYIPEGFAHGFITLEENTQVSYKVSNIYSAPNDGGILWSSVAGLNWGDIPPVLSDKDTKLPTLAEFSSPFSYNGLPLKELTHD
jgi:dTDP-4-dehydrorhamnose 3,5-epimerase